MRYLLIILFLFSCEIPERNKSAIEHGAKIYLETSHIDPSTLNCQQRSIDLLQMDCTFLYANKIYSMSCFTNPNLFPVNCVIDTSK